jgi:hypothetical protein
MAHITNVKNAERKIFRVEHFWVNIRHPNGRDVRSDRGQFPQYDFRVAAADHITVESWKASRFRPKYPGFEVEVLTGNGKPARGNVRLLAIRRSYRD